MFGFGISKYDNFLLISSSVRKWMGGTTLAGLLLVSSLPVLASTQPGPICSSGKPMLAVSTIVPTGTYTNIVRKQLQWTANLVKTDIGTVSVLEKPAAIQSLPITVAARSTNTTHTMKSIIDNMKLIKLSVTSKKLVSRSDNSGLVDRALSLLGVPYIFGGTSSNGFDCSGYAQYVFKSSGISLPRTASEQFKVGASVSRGQLQSGDLVFFTTYAPGASHVGVYIGDGHFVAASNSGVSISDLSSRYYASRYLGARRVG